MLHATLSEGYESVGAALRSRSRVVWAGRNLEWAEGRGQDGGAFRVEHPVDVSHPVEKRGEGEMTTLKLAVRVLQGSIRIDNRCELVPGNPNIHHVDLLR